MAKANTTIDEELYDGLQQARKKKPRYFALITKGADVVGLIVQKKKINDGQAAKAKAEAKGSGVITGVCQGQGVELTFEVLDAEPTIKTIKIKEFINEQTELALKPQWVVVKALTEVKEEDDAPPPTGKPPVEKVAPATPEQPVVSPTAQVEPEPTPKPTTGDPLAELSAKLKALTPAVQTAIMASPVRKTELLGAVDAVKKLIKAEDAAGAQQSLLTLAKLIQDMAGSGSTPSPPTSSDQSGMDESAYTKAKAKFAACRGIWVRVRDEAVRNIHAIRDAMHAQFKDDPDVASNLAEGMQELTVVASRFSDDLKEKFDAFTADPPPPPQDRAALKQQTLALIESYRSEVESNSIFEDLDQKEFLPVLVKGPLVKTLAALAKDLA